ncbi:MAG: hypothetical protein ACK4ND_06550 [Cytophagaceae bacterium]
MKLSTTYRLLTLWPFLIAIVLLGCDIKKNNEVVPETTIKIYDNHTFSDAYSPIDISQTEDEGFIILSKAHIPESNFSGVYLMKVDKDGNFISEQLLDPEYVHPINKLLKVGTEYYFFCMNRLTLGTALFKVDGAGEASIVSELGLMYPLYASLDADGANFILLNYNREDRETDVSRISSTGNITAMQSFPIGFGDFDAEKSILEHMTGGKRLPFLCGYTSNNRYYFNAYYRYTLSLVFFNMSGQKAEAVVNGYKDERAISALLYNPDNNTFSASRFGFGQNFFMPNIPINSTPGAVSSSSDLEGRNMPEIAQTARIILKEHQAGSRYTIYGSDTKGKQIILYFYDPSSGTLRGTKHLGFTNPYEIGNFTSTNTNGLAVVGSTWVSGRFSRICFFRFSEEEVNAMMK